MTQNFRFLLAVSTTSHLLDIACIGHNQQETAPLPLDTHIYLRAGPGKPVFSFQLYV